MIAYVEVRQLRTCLGVVLSSRLLRGRLRGLAWSVPTLDFGRPLAWCRRNDHLVESLVPLETNIETFLIQGAIMSILLLSIDWIHLVQCILNLLVLFSTHVWTALRMVRRLVGPWSEFQIKVYSGSKLIDVDGVLWRLVKIWNIRSAGHETVLILILRHRTICVVVTVILGITLPLTWRSSVLNGPYLVRSYGWSDHRGLRLEWAWDLSTSDDSGGSLRLSVARGLRRTLQFINVDRICLLFPLTLAAVVRNWRCSLSNVISLAHKCILALGLLLILHVALAVWIVNYVLSIWTQQLRIFESLLLILLVHLILALGIGLWA